MPLIAASASVTVALGLLAIAASRPDLAVVERVEFDGHGRATAAELRHLANLPNGTRIWEVPLARVARDVERHPWVDEARVGFRWPATVRVEVVERRPVAMLRGERLVYVDADGAPVAVATTADLDYPLLSGISDDLAALHPELPRRVVRGALDLLARLEADGGVPRADVSEIHFSDTSGFAVHLSAGARLLFDLDGVDRQVRRLAALRAQGVDLATPIQVDLAPASVAIVRPIEVPRAGS